MSILVAAIRGLRSSRQATGILGLLGAVVTNAGLRYRGRLRPIQGLPPGGCFQSTSSSFPLPSLGRKFGPEYLIRLPQMRRILSEALATAGRRPRCTARPSLILLLPLTCEPASGHFASATESVEARGELLGSLSPTTAPCEGPRVLSHAFVAVFGAWESTK